MGRGGRVRDAGKSGCAKYVIVLGLLCAACGLIPAVSAGPADVTVTSYQIDPPVLMKGDTGTITVDVQNTGDVGVPIARARLYMDGIAVLSDPYPSVGDIGAGNSKQFTFSIRADAPEGTYYPKFVLEFRDDGSLRYPIPVQVEDTPLQVAVAQKPNAFGDGREADIVLRVGNPRPNAASGVQVVPQGAGFSVTPTSAFIGTLNPDQSATVSFNLTPSTETNVTFQVLWRNGINTHTADLTLPIVFGEDRRQANPIISNIEVEQSGSTYRATGDISNAGLETARSVIVTAGSPAIPTDPFRVYVVGTLDPDDFSSFEVTFQVAPGTTGVPLIVEYRDDDGNLYSTTTPISIQNQTAGQESGSGTLITGIIIAVVVIVAAGIVVWYVRRRQG
jgi:hypothetical protein